MEGRSWGPPDKTPFRDPREAESEPDVGERRSTGCGPMMDPQPTQFPRATYAVDGGSDHAFQQTGEDQKFGKGGNIRQQPYSSRSLPFFSNAGKVRNPGVSQEVSNSGEEGVRLQAAASAPTIDPSRNAGRTKRPDQLLWNPREMITALVSPDLSEGSVI
jgi:hypothetical protein